MGLFEGVNPFGMIGNIVGSGITSAANIVSTNATNRAQMEIADRNNQTAVNIADANNQMQRDLNAENNAFAAQEAAKTRDADWQKMLHEESYNSPIAQAQRFREAGFNPAVMMSGQGAVASASGGSSAVAQPHGSGVTPSTPVLSTPSLSAPELAPFNIFAGLQSLADIEKAKADAAKSGAEASHLNQVSSLIADEMRETIAGKKLANDLQSAYGSRIHDLELNKVLSEITSNYMLAYKAAEEGKTEESKRLLNDATAEMQKRLGAKYHKEIQNMDKLASAQVQQMLASARESDSKVLLNLSLKTTEDELRSLRRAVLKADETFKNSEASFNMSEVKNNYHQRQLCIAQYLETLERIRGQKFTNDQRERLKDDLDRSIELSTDQQRQDYHNPFRYFGAILGGLAN